ncbi:MAG: carboxypeptidase regulatory-like domain-containing protein, partial [Mucilaginibacter sp.]
IFTNCLLSTMMGLTYDQNNLYITRNYNSGARLPVGIYVNGMPTDYFALNDINSTQVESVEIFFDQGVTSLNSTTNTKGILEVNLKKQPKGVRISKEDFFASLPKANVVNFVPGGYIATREFYAPKYDNPAQSSVGVDLRSTIFWSPNVVTDKTGNTSLEFFNADSTGTYRATIEGMDKDGNIGRYVYRYKVQ